MAYKKDNKGRVLKPGFTQRKDGRYCYRYREDGKTISIYDKNLKDLEAKAEKIKDDKKAKINHKEAKKTLNYWFDERMELRRGCIRESTRMNYIYYYDRFVRDSLGNEKIEDILVSDIKKHYKKLPIKFGTLKIVHNCIKQAFKAAIESRAVREDPTNMDLKDLDSKNTKNKKAEKYALSLEERTAFLGWTEKSPDYCVYVPMFKVLIGTGLRIGEALALTWSDIDLKNNVIYVNKTLTYKVWEDGRAAFRIHPPKTEAGERKVHIISDVREVFLELKKERLSRGMCKDIIDGCKDFVFVNSQKHVYMSTNINKVIVKIIKWYNEEETESAKREDRAPLLLPHFSVHNFRHTYATVVCMTEENPKKAQELLGHKNYRTTMDIYAKVTKEGMEETYKKLDANFRIG